MPVTDLPAGRRMPMRGPVTDGMGDGNSVFLAALARDDVLVALAAAVAAVSVPPNAPRAEATTRDPSSPPAIPGYNSDVASGFVVCSATASRSEVAAVTTLARAIAAFWRRIVAIAVFIRSSNTLACRSNRLCTSEGGRRGNETPWRGPSTAEDGLGRVFGRPHVSVIAETGRFRAAAPLRGLGSANHALSAASSKADTVAAPTAPHMRLGGNCCFLVSVLTTWFSISGAALPGLAPLPETVVAASLSEAAGVLDLSPGNPAASRN